MCFGKQPCATSNMIPWRCGQNDWHRTRCCRPKVVDQPSLGAELWPRIEASYAYILYIYFYYLYIYIIYINLYIYFLSIHFYYLYIYIYVCIVYVYIYIFIIYIIILSLYLCKFIYIYVFVYVNLYIYISTYLYIYISVYIYIYIKYIYLHTYIRYHSISVSWICWCLDALASNLKLWPLLNFKILWCTIWEALRRPCVQMWWVSVLPWQPWEEHTTGSRSEAMPWVLKVFSEFRWFWRRLGWKVPDPWSKMLWRFCEWPVPTKSQPY